jgi:hypothetical protein
MYLSDYNNLYNTKWLLRLKGEINYED